jgi:hypothetical protein
MRKHRRPSDGCETVAFLSSDGNREVGEPKCNCPGAILGSFVLARRPLPTQAAADKYGGEYASRTHDQTTGQDEATEWPAHEEREQLFAGEPESADDQP